MNENPVPSHPFQYSISDDTDDTALASPLSSTPIPSDAFDPIRGGIGSGVKSAICLAFIYALGVPALFMVIQSGLPSPTNMRDVNSILNAIRSTYYAIFAIYSVALPISIFSLIFGGIPALIVGAVNGGIIGMIFRFIVKIQLPFHQALSYGFGLSVLLLGIRLWLGAQLTGISDATDPYIWLVWYSPNLGAFIGLWWVAYQVNTKMPTA